MTATPRGKTGVAALQKIAVRPRPIPIKKHGRKAWSLLAQKIAASAKPAQVIAFLHPHPALEEEALADSKNLFTIFRWAIDSKNPHDWRLHGKCPRNPHSTVTLTVAEPRARYNHEP